jgi:hypothetical protein
MERVMRLEREGKTEDAVAERAGMRLPPLWLFGALAALFLLVAATKDTTDVIEYHCYALDFWQGAHTANAALASQCATKIPDLARAPYHQLPREYGPLALLVFSLPLVAPLGWYNTVFNLLMCGVILAIAWALDRYGPRGAGHIWLLYTLLGVMMEAAGRFDALVAAAVLVALLASQRGRTLLAYSALAVGTLLKFFPLALLPLLLIQSWWRREAEPFWRGPALFAGVALVGEGLAALISPASALEPLSFMGARCVEVESFPATLAFLWDIITGSQVTSRPVERFQSVCQFGSGLDVTPPLATALAVVGILAVYWLVWRGRLSLSQGFLFATGLLILGVKVFSIQYLLWLSPLIAYEYGAQGLALAGWGAVMLASALYFPVANYTGSWLVTHIPLLVALRNLLMVVVGALALRDVLRAPGAVTPAGGGAP